MTFSHDRHKNKGHHTMVTAHPRVVLLNHPGSGADDRVLPIIASALDRQVKEHFGPLYNLSADVVASETTLSSDWIIGMFKDPDQPGALGYHDTTARGLPLAKVFPLLDAQDGGELSVTISHELLEMLADPYLRLGAQDNQGRFWAYEVCDAVEADDYPIDGVKVSNFVTPQYFEPPADTSGVLLDWLGQVRTPFEVRPGGYMQWFDGRQWNQVINQQRAQRAYRAVTHGRCSRRALARQRS